MLSLLKDIDDFDVILASQSPRRYELLKMIGLNFKVRPSHIEEKLSDDLSPVEYALSNARKKGQHIAQLSPESLVISADTIVVHKNDILEKPTDEKHARDILRKLSGNTHEVITAFGISLQSKNKNVFDHEITKVTFRNLSQKEISVYTNTGESFDKAGGYGAQGTGSLLIKRVEGCFFNVVGLPLSSFFFDP
ncbi:septum formation protein [Candidatus Methanophagaceae archaeon]|nr:septum formation protein [Methanophagales archaeon]